MAITNSDDVTHMELPTCPACTRCGKQPRLITSMLEPLSAVSVSARASFMVRSRKRGIKYLNPARLPSIPRLIPGKFADAGERKWTALKADVIKRFRFSNAFGELPDQCEQERTDENI
jgi:hypothetical protein